MAAALILLRLVATQVPETATASETAQGSNTAAAKAHVTPKETDADIKAQSWKASTDSRWTLVSPWCNKRSVGTPAHSVPLAVIAEQAATIEVTADSEANTNSPVNNNNNGTAGKAAAIEVNSPAEHVAASITVTATASSGCVPSADTIAVAKARGPSALKDTMVYSPNISNNNIGSNANAAAADAAMATAAKVADPAVFIATYS